MYERINSNTTLYGGAKVRELQSSGAYEHFIVGEVLSDNEEYELKSDKVVTGYDTGTILFIEKSSMISGKWEIETK